MVCKDCLWLFMILNILNEDLFSFTQLFVVLNKIVLFIVFFYPSKLTLLVKWMTLEIIFVYISFLPMNNRMIFIYNFQMDFLIAGTYSTSLIFVMYMKLCQWSNFGHFKTMPLIFDTVLFIKVPFFIENTHTNTTYLLF